jgi:hypothetical protein
MNSPAQKPTQDQILQFMTTARFTLQTARAAAVAEANGRSTLYLGSGCGSPRPSCVLWNYVTFPMSVVVGAAEACAGLILSAVYGAIIGVIYRPVVPQLIVVIDAITNP